MTLTSAELQDLNGKIGRELTAACKDPAVVYPRLLKILRLVENAAGGGWSPYGNGVKR